MTTVSASRRARALGVGALLGLIACSSGTGTQNPTVKPGDKPPGTGTPMTMMPAPDYDAGAPSGLVDILIRSPLADALLSTNGSADVTAKVSISQGTDLIDPSSVRATLTDGAGNVLSAGPLVGPSGDSEYRGKLSLSGVKTGAYTITVVARSTTNVSGTASVAIRVDSGPLITVLSPVPGKHYKTSLVVQLAVDAGDLGPATEVQATIAGMPLTLMPTGTNQYRTMFDLVVPVALVGDQIFTVSAKNTNNTRTELRFVFNVDVVGPTISMTRPGPGEIVGGIVKISAQVLDDGGVNDSSVQALVGDKTAPQFKLSLKREMGTDVFSVLFDTKLLTGCKLTTDLCIVRPTVSFRASDLLGNDATVSYEFAVDNIPPIADLVPPPIHVWKRDSGFRCSHSFDPLDHNITAGDAPDDLCQIPQMFDLRARIQDVGNHAAGLKQMPISKVDPEATAAYVLDTTVLNGEPQPLVVDTDNDGYCDAVNPKLQPTTLPLTGPRQVLKIRMRPVPPAGEADFATTDPNLPAGCLPGLALDPPPNLCKPGPQPSIAISYANFLPAIWSIEPISPMDPAYCFGSQFDTLANNVTGGRATPTSAPGPAGWKCIAVVTADMNGNTSTSVPIRVYLDDYKYGGSVEFCKNKRVPLPASVGAPPSCTGTYDKATGVVSQKACKARTFTLPPQYAPELCEKGNCDIWDEFL